MEGEKKIEPNLVIKLFEHLFPAFLRPNIKTCRKNVARVNRYSYRNFSCSGVQRRLPVRNLGSGDVQRLFSGSRTTGAPSMKAPTKSPMC